MAILRVLIVDDNPMLLGMITDIVGEFGHAPIAVSTADAAIEALSAGDIDVLLSDITLGHGVSGVDLILDDRVVMPPAVVLMSGNPKPDGVAERHALYQQALHDPRAGAGITVMIADRSRA